MRPDHVAAGPDDAVLRRIEALETSVERLAALESENVSRMVAEINLNARVAELEVRLGVNAQSFGPAYWKPVKWAAGVAGVSDSCIHDWRRKEKIVWRKEGGRVLIDMRSLPKKHNNN